MLRNKSKKGIKKKNENKNNMSSMNEDENTVMASSLTKEEGSVTLCLDETNTENEVMQTCVGDCQTGCDHDCSLDDCTICNPNTGDSEPVDNSNTMETAIELSYDELKMGCICCPEGQMWYKFVASAPDCCPDTTIFTTGSLDTYGELYDENGVLLTCCDDVNGRRNFKIIRELENGKTYYVRVTLFSHNSGDFIIKITNDIIIDSVNLRYTVKTIRVGESFNIGATISPSNATDKRLYFTGSYPEYAAVDEYGIVTGVQEGESRIYVETRDGSNITEMCTVIVSGYMVTCVNINQSEIEININDNYALSATVCPVNATDKSLKWISMDSDIADVDENSGMVIGKAEGTTTICVTSQDGSNVSDACAVVVKYVPITHITLSPNPVSIKKGKQRRLQVAIEPENASNKNLNWWSTTDNGESIVSIEKSTGKITGLNEGTTTVYAESPDNEFICGETVVTVTPLTSVISITVCPDVKTLSPGEQISLGVIFDPITTDYTDVTWESDDESIAIVDENGIVGAVSAGETIITATAHNGKNSTCKIIVDTRERVTIKKDSHSFYVQFNDGKRWNFIGLDLSKRSENYKGWVILPDFNMDNYESLIKEEQRYLDNIYVEKDGSMVRNTYSVNQIAYLYLFDPLGIEYYMRKHACDDKDIMSGEFLSYKDEVYEAIFGNSERLSGRFYFTIVDDTVCYGRYSGKKRMDVFSNAEVLFGAHTIFNFDALMNHILKEVFTGFIPGYSCIQLGVEMFQAMFFSGAIVGTGTDAAANLIIDYVDNMVQSTVHDLLGWAGKYLDYLSTVVNIIDVSFDTMNSNDINLFIKANDSPYYRAVFDTPSLEVTLNELIEKYNE